MLGVETGVQPYKLLIKIRFQNGLQQHYQMMSRNAVINNIGT